MFKSHLGRHILKLSTGSGTKRTSGTRQDDPLQRRACAAIEALENGIVLTVYRQDLHSFAGCGRHDKFTGHNQNFLARNREIFPSLNRGQRRLQTRRADNGNQHHVCLRKGGQINELLLAV